MKLSESVVTESRHIAVGVGILCAAMLAVFLILGKMTWDVALGAVIGYALAVGNFFLMAVDVQRTLDSVSPNEEGAAKLARAKMRFSYNRRMAVILVALIVSIFVIKVSWISVMVPLICPRIVIKATQFIKRRKVKGSEG